MAKAIIAALSVFPKEAIQTITCDRGSKFACWREIEKALNCDMYFADPYCAWQKGTNENLNGLLREFYPKGSICCKICFANSEQNLHISRNKRPCKGERHQTALRLWYSELYLFEKKR